MTRPPRTEILESAIPTRHPRLHTADPPRRRLDFEYNTPQVNKRPRHRRSPPRAQPRKKVPRKRRLHRRRAERSSRERENSSARDYADNHRYTESYLDSCYLLWKLNMSSKLTELSASALTGVLRREIIHFNAMGWRDCRRESEKIRDALIRLARNSDERRTYRAVEAPEQLRDLWVVGLRAEIQHIDKRERERRESVRPGPFVESVLEQRPGTGRRDREDRGDTSAGGQSDSDTPSSSDRSRSSVCSETESEGPEPPPERRQRSRDDRRDGAPPRRIVVDDRVRENLQLIRRAKTPADLDARAIAWITDEFAGGSPHIQAICNGTIRDPDWSQAEFDKACREILHTCELSEDRQKYADGLSATAKEAMLKRESKAYDNICITLHLIRIGKAGAKRFRENLENEAARDHFERFFENKRSFKQFLKEIEDMQSKPAPRPRQPRPNQRGRNNRRRRQQRSAPARRQPQRRPTRQSSNNRRPAGRDNRAPRNARYTANGACRRLRNRDSHGH